MPLRLPVRLAWVSAELAMASGDGRGRAPRRSRRRAGRVVRFGASRRKSDVILAAALCSAGEIEASRRVADAALQDTDRLGIIPLCWALACLLADIGSARHSAADVLRIRNECAATVRRRGGDLAQR